MTAYGLGLDTGGTYTDIVLFDLNKKRVCRKAKVPTTHHNYRLCLDSAVKKLNLSKDEASKLKRVGLSTTLATNAIAENKLGNAGLLIEAADIRLHDPIHSHQVLLKSCMDYKGYEITPVSKTEVIEAASKMANEVEAFAVSGYAATRNCGHEEQIAEILKSEFGKPVVQAHELSHQFNFIQRARAALLNAGLLSKMKPWQKELKDVFTAINENVSIYIVSGDGSLMTLQEAEFEPIKTILSGPASSILGGLFLSGEESAFVVDVGGTTLDIGRIVNGNVELCKGAAQAGGHRLAMDTLDVTAYGLGGDSAVELGKDGIAFSANRVLPYARLGELKGDFSFEELNSKLEFRWMHGDPEWLELVGMPEYSGDNPQGKHVETLLDGPKIKNEFEQSVDAGEDWKSYSKFLKSKNIQRVAFTPTDLACVSDMALPYLSETSNQAFEAYMKMLGQSKDQLQHTLKSSLQRQVLKILFTHLCDINTHIEFPRDHEKSILKHLNADKTGEKVALLLDSGAPIIILGAAGKMFFEGMPKSIEKSLKYPEDGDVANAIGAVCARFVFRDEGVIEVGRYKGGDVILHHGRMPFDTIEEAEDYVVKKLKEDLMQKVKELGLIDPNFHVQRETIEVPLEFRQGTRVEEIRYKVKLEANPA